MGQNNKNNTKDRLKKIVNQFSGNVSEDDTEELIPEWGIKGTGYLFCFCPSKRMFVKINRGSKAFIVEGDPEHSKKVLIYTYEGDLVEVESEELEYTGFD